MNIIKSLPHVLISGIPKSGTLYLARSVAETLNMNKTFEFRISSRGLTEQQVQAKCVQKFMEEPAKVLHEHIAPSTYNLSILRELGLRRFIQIIRDPRDIICSLAHHLNRPDARTPWHSAMAIASGLITGSYYELSRIKQLDVLIEMAFPVVQKWIADWLPWLDDSEFDIHLIRYEDFAIDNASSVREVLMFFGIDNSCPLHLPPVKVEDGKIDLQTHFRKGKVGTYMAELTEQQIVHLESLIDKELFLRMEWSF